MRKTLYNAPIIITLLSMLIIGNQVFAAADYAREKRWANEILPTIMVGEPIYLTQHNRHSFLGLYAAEKNSPTALLIVHGMGLNPNWGMIGTLRRDLFDAGYTTLSIQMPVLAANAGSSAYPALFPEAVERLQLAVTYLKKQGYRRIVIISHSNGSRMSRVYMASNPSQVNAWVALSLTQGDTFAGIKVPILDLYGSNDLDHVLRSTEKRKASFRNRASRQIMINGADHFFAGREEIMIAKVKAFLQEPQ